MQVQRELYLAADEGIAMYSQNPCYSSAHGQRLVESVKHDALHFDVQGRKVYYHPRIFRRYSDDNGQTWQATPDQSTESPQQLAGQRRMVSLHALDTSRDALVSIYTTYEIDMSQEMFATGNRRHRTCRIWYELSFNGGRSWTAAQKAVDERPPFDDIHWGPNLVFGHTGAAIDLAAPVWLDDGTVVFGLTMLNAPQPGDDVRDEKRRGNHGVIYLRGRWNEAGNDMRWQLGAPIVLTPEQSPVGCCEPAAIGLGGNRVFNTMRCQGSEELGIYATRYSTISNDGGMTWSEPQPLRYDNGDIVWTPASLSSFFRSSKTGRCYWLANILPGPVYGQMPRYPLCIAEFDTQRCCIFKDSMRIIQDRTQGLPEQVRYTNWGFYEERGSGDLILTLPEQPKLMDFTAMTRPQDFTADCYRYRIRLPEYSA